MSLCVEGSCETHIIKSKFDRICSGFLELGCEMKVYSSHLPTLPLALSPEEHPKEACLTKERENSWWLFMASEQRGESKLVSMSSLPSELWAQGDGYGTIG